MPSIYYLLPINYELWALALWCGVESRQNEALPSRKLDGAPSFDP